MVNNRKNNPSKQKAHYSPEKNPRIFLGPVEIANVVGIISNVLRNKGIRVTAVTSVISPYFRGMRYDNILTFQGNRLQRISKRAYYFLKYFLQHDAFVFLFGRTLLPYNLDLPFYRLFRKKTVMWFMGSDIRHYESLEVAARKAGVKYFVSKDQGTGPKAFKRKLRMIHMVEKHVDFIICGHSYAQLLTRNYLGKDVDSKIYLPLDVENIRYNNVPNEIPLVIHSPTAPKLKGTPYIVNAVEQLKNEGYDFVFRLFENTSNIVVRKTLTEADIAVDQLFATGNGMFATEAMAAGCAVLGGNIPEFSRRPKELPVIHTDPDNIYENLKILLENSELRRELGEKGRRYVEKYHDSRKIADDILKLLEGNIKGLNSYNSNSVST